MEQYHYGRTRAGESEAASFVVERQKFLNNVEALRKTSRETSAIILELQCLFEELTSIREDITSLTESINNTAKRLGL